MAERNVLTERSRGWIRLDSVLLAVVTGLTLLLTVMMVRWHSVPAEDALMLMRYATNFAHGAGITWNPGSPPVEGATDFLYLMALTLWMKISSLDAIMAARTLSAAAHIVCVVLLYVSGRRLFGGHPAVVGALALYLGSGPGIWNTSDGFSGAFYGLAALATWYFGCKAVVDGPTTGRAVGFGVCALMMGLTRPDGVFMAIFMTAALIYFLRGQSKRIVLVTLAIFVVLGGAYFAWRWHYFGYLLPNPFYRKGGGHLHWDGFKKSNGNTIKMLLPVIPVFAVGLALKRARRTTLFVLIPVICFAWVWVLLSNENNANMRFQYAGFAVGLMSVPLILKAMRNDEETQNWGIPVQRRTLLLVMGCTFLMSLLWWRLLFPATVVGSGEYNIATQLAKWKDRNYTLTTTEAGVIPYFSTWRSIDAYGLNDAEIVHNPHGLTEAYLDANHPALLIFHLALDGVDQKEFEAAWKGEAPGQKDLRHQMQVTSHYALTHGYTLAARWGEFPCNSIVYYVRNDLPEFHEMMTLIRKEPHYFQPSDVLSTNYLQDEPPHECSEDGVHLK